MQWKESSHYLRVMVLQYSMDEKVIENEWNTFSLSLQEEAISHYKKMPWIPKKEMIKFLIEKEFQRLKNLLITFWKEGAPCCWECGIFYNLPVEDQSDWWIDDYCNDCRKKIAFEAENRFDEWDRAVQQSRRHKSKSLCDFCGCIPNRNDPSGECNCARDDSWNI